MKRYIGIDGGGTKTAAVIIDEDGNEIGRGSGGACNIASHDEVTLAQSVQDAIFSACASANLDSKTAHFRAVCAGVAGYSAPSRRAPFLALLREAVAAEAYHLDGDFVAAWWGATGGEPGVIIIAGTGAVAYGRNAAGQAHQEDGLGYLLGDKGSGFSIGMQALHHAVSHLREEKTSPLTEAVLHHLNEPTLSGVVQWLYPGFSTARVASLAPIVGTLADRGDVVAQTLIYNAAKRLRGTTARALRKLGLPATTPIYPLGGLWKISASFGVLFESAKPTVFLDAEGKPLVPQPDRRLRLAEPKYDAAMGAALLARTLG